MCVFLPMLFFFSEKVGPLFFIRTLSNRMCQNVTHMGGSQFHPQTHGEPQPNQRVGNVGKAKRNKTGLSWYG